MVLLLKRRPYERTYYHRPDALLLLRNQIWGGICAYYAIDADAIGEANMASGAGCRCAGGGVYDIKESWAGGRNLHLLRE
ncbi:MAG: hypothetical protein WCB53_21265 [Terriglobales bacterium]